MNKKPKQKLSSHLRAKSTSAENGFSQAYILMALIPLMISLVSLSRSSVRAVYLLVSRFVNLPKSPKVSRHCDFSNYIVTPLFNFYIFGVRGLWGKKTEYTHNIRTEVERNNT